MTCLVPLGTLISVNGDSETEIRSDVTVVGGGPSGAATAYWLAMRGFDVTVVEKKIFPRDKTCGDGLTPRAVVQLEAMGMADFLKTQHRYVGLRAVAFGRSFEIPWPKHPEFPEYGYVSRRSLLDQAVLDRAREAGARVLMHHEALSAETGAGGLAAVLAKNLDTGEVCRLVSKFYVLAEGSNARVSRSLGAVRNPGKPLGLAIRAYHPTARASEEWIESHLELRDDSGAIIPGYGWIFPAGNGAANVGFGLLSNRSRWRRLNTTRELQRFIDATDSSWTFGDAEFPATGGKLPMGLAISPISGPNHIMVGDAAASINPFNGEGISYAYETGRLAAGILTQALATGDASMIKAYPEQLRARFGLYYAVGNAFVRLISEPKLMSAGVWSAMRSPALMAPVVTVMANLLPGSSAAQVERIYRLANAARERFSSAG